LLFVTTWLPLVVYFCVSAGAPLFLFLRLLGWLRSPRWLIGIFGGLFAGVVALSGVSAAGASIALSPYPVDAGGVARLVFGALRLTTFRGAVEPGPVTWKRGSAILATILGCGVLVFYPLAMNRAQAATEVLLVRVVLGPQPLDATASAAGLTKSELELLKSLGLTGRVRFGAAGTTVSWPGEVARGHRSHRNAPCAGRAAPARPRPGHLRRATRPVENVPGRCADPSRHNQASAFEERAKQNRGVPRAGSPQADWHSWPSPPGRH
jgi:hypothetical protein